MVHVDRVMVIGHASGSVCSAIFPDEDEAVLFLPYSGDVLQSSAQAVEGLVGYFSCPSTERMIVPLSPDTESLLATLQQLGVDVD